MSVRTRQPVSQPASCLHARLKFTFFFLYPLKISLKKSSNRNEEKKNCITTWIFFLCFLSEAQAVNWGLRHQPVLFTIFFSTLLAYFCSVVCLCVFYWSLIVNLPAWFALFHLNRLVVILGGGDNLSWIYFSLLDLTFRNRNCWVLSKAWIFAESELVWRLLWWNFILKWNFWIQI